MIELPKELADAMQAALNARDAADKAALDAAEKQAAAKQAAMDAAHAIEASASANKELEAKKQELLAVVNHAFMPPN